MSGVFQLPFQTSDGLIDCQLQLLTPEETDNLTLQMLVPYTLAASAQTWFEALCLLREQLETKGAFLLCYGAALNFYPSPMSLSMGEGRSVYELHLGRAARSHHLHDIFDTREGLQVATVAEQRQFYSSWLASLQGGHAD